MKLLRETLTNFKGLRSFTIEPNGNNISVFGDNAKGKSTLFDAFLWVFFDKDSSGRKDFELKTLDETGKAIPMIDHSVELVIEHNGKKVTIKKTLTENWVKARGSINAEFSGHKTAYEIDGVPRQKREFDAFISHLCDESILRMLTDPDYFPGKMSWQDRRKMLMDVCGDISDADVIDSAVTIGNKSMLDLLNVLNAGRTIDEHKKVIAAKKTAVNNEIKAIPVRVDEATRALPAESDVKAADLQAETDKARPKLQAAETSLLTLDQGGAVTQKKLRLQKIEAGLIAEQNKAAASGQTVILAKNKEFNELRFGLDRLEFNRTSARSKITQLSGDIARLKEQREVKLAEWTVESEKEAPESQISNTCPSCGQSLPEEQIQAAIGKALASFNASRATNVKRIEEEGSAIRAKLDAAEAEQKAIEQSIPVMDTEISTLTDKINALQIEITALNNQPAPSESLETKSLLHEKGNLLIDIKALEESGEPERIRLTAERDKLREEVSLLEQAAARTKARADGLKRIEELKAQEKTLAAEYEQLERQTYLTEEFIRTKVNLLESRINSRFRLARFKLFDVQINGALNECCETTYNGVPYSGGLNNGARINVGLDIIRTLSEHYGISAPIFIDNAESVTEIIDTESQQIRLVVSAADQTLRVEEINKC